MASIGFIGLGNMGGHMARNLIKQGRKLVVFDSMPQSVDELKAAGATAASSAAEVSEACSDIVTMLPANDEVREVYLGKKGILTRFIVINPIHVAGDTAEALKMLQLQELSVDEIVLRVSCI